MSAGLLRTTGLVLAALALVRCDSETPQPEPLTPVRVETVESHDVGGGLRYSATIAPKTSVDVSFRVSGNIESITQETGADGQPRDIQTGDTVNKDAILAQVGEQDYQDKVKEAKAQLGQAQAALTKANSDFKRASALYNEQSMTGTEYDTYKKEYQNAQAEVAGAKAQLDQAQLELSYCKLRSPLAGVVLQRNVEVGTLVSPGTVGFVVADVSSVKAVFGVPAAVLKDVKEGSQLSITTASLPNQSFPGTVTSIAAQADSSTRVFQVEVTVPNEKGLLRPNMVASLDLPSANTQAQSLIVVPIAAVVRAKDKADGYAVFVVDGSGQEQTVRQTDIDVGDVLGDGVTVTSGLKTGEQVVVYGATQVSDGQKVRVIP